MPHSFTRHPPDSMLRPPSRFTDSSAPAETLHAVSGRCGRRVRATSVSQAPESCGYAGPRLLRAGYCVWCAETFRHRSHSLFVMPFRTAFPSFPIYLSIRPITERRERDAVLFHFGSNGSYRRRFHPLFIASFSTVFSSSSPYTTPAITGGEPGRETVLSSFRKYDSRFRGSHCNSGKCAALAGFREGGRAGKPMPSLSLFVNILFSDRQNNVGKGYIQFKSRPSDRRHAYF